MSAPPDTGTDFVYGITAIGMPSSSGGTAVTSSGTDANCIPRGDADVLYPELGVYVALASDHTTLDVSAAFFKESISRPIIMGMYL